MCVSFSFNDSGELELEDSGRKTCGIDLKGFQSR